MSDKRIVKRYERMRSQCSGCPLEDETYVFSELPRSPIDKKSFFCIMGEAPGQEESMKGRPFVGRAGRLLMEALSELEIERKYQYIMNVIDCRPPKNDFKHASALEARSRCEGGLTEEIRYAGELGFRVMLVLGNNASSSLSLGTGMKALHGRIIERDGWAYVPTYHPSFITRKGGRSHEEIWSSWLQDIEIAKNVSLEETYDS